MKLAVHRRSGVLAVLAVLAVAVEGHVLHRSRHIGAVGL